MQLGRQALSPLWPVWVVLERCEVFVALRTASSVRQQDGAQPTARGAQPTAVDRFRRRLAPFPVLDSPALGGASGLWGYHRLRRCWLLSMRTASLVGSAVGRLQLLRALPQHAALHGTLWRSEPAVSNPRVSRFPGPVTITISQCPVCRWRLSCLSFHVTRSPDPD